MDPWDTEHGDDAGSQSWPAAELSEAPARDTWWGGRLLFLLGTEHSPTGLTAGQGAELPHQQPEPPAATAQGHQGERWAPTG